MVEKSKLDEDKEGKTIDPSHYRGSAYRKASLCSQKDLSIPSWNRSLGSMKFKLLKHAKQWFAIISDSNPLFILKASIPPKRKLDLTTGIHFLRTMATIIEQQVALDEDLVPSTQRLMIERSNFRLPSDIQSKESTLQLVYDVLRRCPFFKAFLVTTDVPKVYMQAF
nr:hypothetical protein [Tanacetum cinerariifolium]